MKKSLLAFLLVLGFVIVGTLAVKFYFGGDEDTWICENGEWIMHGKPRQPKPMTECGEVKEGWQKQVFNEAGLSLSLQTPTDTTFRKEIAEDGDRIRAAAFYVERGEKDNPTYQLYALYQPLDIATEADLERARTGMDPKTVKEVMIGGYKGIEGLTMISGPKNHYETVIVKDGKLFSIATWPPTEENKALTDQIIATIKFE